MEELQKIKMQFNPPENRHRPASRKSQDISHVLANTFKDIYTRDIIGKDTVSNLIKTRTGQDSYHDRYVQELQQAYSEYSQQMKEADMLENHIIKARAQAAAREREEYERIKEYTGGIHDLGGLYTIRSALPQFLDNDLLKRNNLIGPDDYLKEQKPVMKPPPVEAKPDPTKPTISYKMHLSREPQDNDYTRIPKVTRSESDLSLTTDCSSETPKNVKTPHEKPCKTKPRPKWKDEPSAQDWAEGRDKLCKIKDRNSFLRNPRFLPLNAPQGGTSLILPRNKVKKAKHEMKGIEEQSSTNDTVPVFVANPSVLAFTGYNVGNVYEATLELINLTSLSQHARVIPPATSYFSIGLGKFPGEGGIIAPGMSCKYTVRFTPDTLANYDDVIMVETRDQHVIIVAIEARRPPPILTLPKVLDCGHCLIGGVKFVDFLCKNVGQSAGTFCIIPKNKWPASNLKCFMKTYFCELPPFAISPSLFALQPGETTVVEVVFFPTTAERRHQVFTIVCDNCQVKDISIEGEGQLIALELVSVSGEKEPPVVGEARDLTAEHLVRFGPCNPQSVQQKKLVIRNNTHLELPFRWQIMKPNLYTLLPGEIPDPSHIQFHLSTDNAFHVSPTTGLLDPCQDNKFLFSFCPKQLKHYHSVCHLVVRDVPQLAPEPSDKSVQPLHTRSQLSDVIVMEIEVKGSTEPYQVLLDPYAIVIPGECFLNTTVCKKFRMWNHSKSTIFFQWEKITNTSYSMEVVPSNGEVVQNKCLEFDLVVTAEKAQAVVTSLVCHIEHHHEPVTLSVEVCFTGLKVMLSVPNIDFGLLSLGEHTNTTLLLTNPSHQEATWTLEERHDSQRDHQLTQVTAEPCKGVLPSMSSCSVDVHFQPRFCQQFETVLDLKVQNGSGCQLLLRAHVETPRVRLLSCELHLSDVYIGVPVKSQVTLISETMLPSCFTWKDQLQGKHAALCTARFEPSSGTLAPCANMDIAIHFTSHADLELTEVLAVCEIQMMSSPLVLHFLVSKPKKMSVSYSLSSNRCTPVDQASSALLLHFGDVILKKAVTKQLIITNETAVPTPFSVAAEYFTCHECSTATTKTQSQTRFTYIRRALHSAQARKVEEKAHEDFVSRLLAHGKGAAFLILPECGILGPFHTQTVDVTAYTEMWGEYRDYLVCKVGDLEPRLIPMQMTVTGCPLYFQMTGPCPKEQHRGPTIQFGTHVSGGDTVSRSLCINNPTTFDIRVDWEISNINENDRKLVDVAVACEDAFPVKDVDGSGGFSQTLRNTDGSSHTSRDSSEPFSPEGANASLQSTTDGEQECIAQDDGVEEENSLYPRYAKKNLSSVHIRPHLGNFSDYPYCVTPEQIVIPAKSSRTIHASFTPLTISGSSHESRCVGLALGFMSLDSKTARCVPGKVGRAQGLDLKPITVKLLAIVKPAALLVEMDEHDGVLRFGASSGDLLNEELVVQEFDTTQSFKLRNTTEMALHFRLGTQLPFSVVQPQPRVVSSTSSNPSTAETQYLVLQPQHKMQVTVAFHCSLSLLDHMDQTEEKHPPGVKLIHSACGQRKLSFQESLLIHFNNNSLQTVPLQAHVDLASLCLSSDTVDFGTCFLGQSQIKEVNLFSSGAHISWKAVTEGDSHVFKVTPDSGLLRSKELRVSTCTQHLQISFTASEDREFRAEVTIQSPLVKTAVTLQLRGTGSFDERHITNSMFG
ncbi:deleted in lung and esophageal cancer protein 1 [Thalassophryne amazonica]|uniref:deleted in lung and esophageal cancer protein 1 n=1 Tax=Thalassophryne amazonica TaxID=390379 RepID=UPI001470DEBE|nr:deleted in lung and esophageal cancer protein 1 [Thalassophryne amazonica]